MTAEQTVQALSASLAPVFLISGVGLLLNGMTARYGRVIDRTRMLLREGKQLYARDTSHDHLEDELRSLFKRAKLLRTTIILASSSIFFIVLTVFLLFAKFAFEVQVAFGPQFCFLASLIVLLVAMSLFIEDFAISLRVIHNDIRVRGHVEAGEKPAKSPQV